MHLYRFSSLLILGLAACVASAQVGTSYTSTFVARDWNGAFGPFNMAGSAYLHNMNMGFPQDIQVLNSGFIGMRVNDLSNVSGIWRGGPGAGTFALTPPVRPSGSISLNELGNTVFVADRSLYGMQSGFNTASLLLTLPNTRLVSTFKNLADGRVAYSDTDNAGANRVVSIFNPADGSTQILTQPDAGIVSQNAPMFNNSGQALVQRKITGSSGNELVIYNTDGSITVVARDTAADSSSPYGEVKAVGLTDDGWAAFRTPASGGRIQVILKKGADTKVLLDTTNPLATTLMDLSSTGVLTYAMADGLNSMALYAADGTTTTIVTRFGDILGSDLGNARLSDPGDAFFKGLGINSAGQIAFVAALRKPTDNNEPWGYGLYLATPNVVPEPASLAALGIGALALIRRRRRRD